MITRNDAEKKFANFLGKEDILVPNKAGALEFMGRRFKDLGSVSSQVFDNLCTLLDQHPQKAIDLIDDMASGSLWAAMTATLGKKEEGVYNSIELISMHWETARFYRLTSHLISGLRAPIDSLTKPQAIFSHLGAFGLDAIMIEDMRLIRNAKSHLFTLNAKSIIYEDDRGIKHEIEFDRIDNICQILDRLSSWWNTFLFIQFRYMPKFCILASYTIITRAKTNADSILEYNEGLKRTFSIVEEQLREAPAARTLPVNKRIELWLRQTKRKLFRVLRIDDNSHAFFLDNAGHLISRFDHHLARLHMFFQDITSRLDDADDIKNLSAVDKWIGDFGTVFTNLDEETFRGFFYDE